MKEWPYSKVSDPQYIGCLCTVAGCLTLGGNFAPVDLLLWWAGNYFYLIFLESRVPTGVAMA